MATKSNKVDIINVNAANLLAYLSNADINEQQIVVIDIAKGKLVCRAYPTADQSVNNIPWIKSTKTDIVNVFEIKSKLDDGISYIKIPMYRLKKFKDALKLFVESGSENISGVIGITGGDDDKSLICTYVDIVAKNLKIRVNAIESYMVKLITDEKWDAFHNHESYIAKLDIKKDFIERLKSLCNIESGDDDGEKVKSFVIKITKDTVSFMSKDSARWNIGYNTEKDGNCSINTEKDVLLFAQLDIIKVMTAPMYEMVIFYNESKGQYIMLVSENEDNIIVRGLSEFDPSLA